MSEMTSAFGRGRPGGALRLVAAPTVAAAALLMIWFGIRSRNRDAAYGIQQEPTAIFYIRNAVMAAALIFVGWKLARFLPG